MFAISIDSWSCWTFSCLIILYYEHSLIGALHIRINCGLAEDICRYIFQFCFFLVLYGWSQSTSVLGKSECAIIFWWWCKQALHLSDGMFSSCEDVRKSRPGYGKKVKKSIYKQKKEEINNIHFFGNSPLYLQMIAQWLGRLGRERAYSYLQ